MTKDNIIYQDLLFELGVEELPTKAVKNLSTELVELLKQELKNNKLSFNNISTIATPRRLGFIIKELQNKQEDFINIKKGPSIESAYINKNNNTKQFTKAAIGFIKSCNLDHDNPKDIKKLEILKSDKGEYLVYNQKITGKKTTELLENIINNSIKKLSVPKPMRWSNYEFKFVRPVHWGLLIYGNKTVKINIFNITTSNKTFGHRFMAPEAIVINNIAEYTSKLKQAFVITDFELRLNTIKKQILKLIPNYDFNNFEDLLIEVCSLVEWPVAQIGEFNKKFLDVPKECLITSMISHQKYFPVFDNNKLINKFIFISNIKSSKPKQVIQGNEKVLAARLADAEFFYHNDQKIKLKDRINKLDKIIYQQKLGTLLDKTNRISNLSIKIAELLNNKIKLDTNTIQTASKLIKADLTTEMVFEFPELQGTMGKYYAILDKETKLTADIIEQHYLPKFSGDILPSSIEACIVAMADKLDTIVGIFAIGQKPTGEKDPFSLRRAALGILRILIEKKIKLSLYDLINLTVNNYSNIINKDNKINKDALLKQCLDFCFDRLKAYYAGQNISTKLYASVKNTNTHSPYDFNQRIIAVNKFITLPQANNLIAANKRVKNILSKDKTYNTNNIINIEKNNLKQPQEIALYNIFNNKQQELNTLLNNTDNSYQSILTNLAELQEPLDDFFDHVMVNCEDKELKNNRLLLLNNIRNLFNQVADISELN